MSKEQKEKDFQDTYNKKKPVLRHIEIDEISQSGPFKGQSVLHILAGLPKDSFEPSDYIDFKNKYKKLCEKRKEKGKEIPNINVRDNDGATPLLIATFVENPVMIITLSDLGADLFLTDYDNTTPLRMTAIMASESKRYNTLDTILFLIRKKMNQESPDRVWFGIENDWPLLSDEVKQKLVEIGYPAPEEQRQKIVEEESKRLAAEAEAEAKRIRLAQEALAAEAERKRLAAEAERQRIAREEAAEAERQRIAQEAERKRLAAEHRNKTPYEIQFEAREERQKQEKEAEIRKQFIKTLEIEYHNYLKEPQIYPDKRQELINYMTNAELRDFLNREGYSYQIYKDRKLKGREAEEERLAERIRRIREAEEEEEERRRRPAAQAERERIVQEERIRQPGPIRREGGIIRLPQRFGRKHGGNRTHKKKRADKKKSKSTRSK